MVTLRQRRQEEVRSRPEPVRRQALFPLRPGSFFDSALLGRYKGCTPAWVEWKASGSDSTHPAAADPSPAEPAEPAAPPAAAASARHDEAGAAGAGPLFGEGSEGDEDLFGEGDAAEGSGKVQGRLESACGLKPRSRDASATAAIASNSAGAA